jgi:hypothetical protein
MLVAFASPDLGFGLICAARIPHLHPMFAELQINNHIASRLCAADEDIAIGRFVEWFW